MIEMLVILVVVGVCLWMVNTYTPLAPPIKTVINVIVVLFLVVWLLNMFGITNFSLPKS